MSVPHNSPAVHPVHGAEEVPHAGVEISRGFWARRQQISREVTIPHALDCLEKDGHVSNFDKAAGAIPGDASGHHAFDSDLHKALEGAVCALAVCDDPALAERSENLVGRILAAQQPDGFLITHWILKDPQKRWDDMRMMHQLYNTGHFFELAVAHHSLTGCNCALDAACRFADLVDSVFGEGKRYDVDGHQEVELALVRLYRATGERRYFELARFFLDERGHAHGDSRAPFDPASIVYPTRPEGDLTDDQRREFRRATFRVRNGRMQDHKPVVEQTEAIGHAVRAAYMYAAMADVARFSQAPGYRKALDAIWADIVGRKMYVTGAIGTGQYGDEGFGDPYLLPNDTAYCETCAAIANVLWQHRMCLLARDARYADVMELTLHNSMLSGTSLAGNAFFYENPLTSDGTARRRTWIGLSCCPTNVARIIPQVGGLAYARDGRRLLVNLYMPSRARVDIDGCAVTIAQDTDYPWDGRIRLSVEVQNPCEFELCLRLPGWASGQPVPSDLYRFAGAEEAGGAAGDKPADSEAAITLSVNGRPVDLQPRDGYARIQRTWQGGDAVELVLPMPVRRVRAHENVEADRGKVALMRGPIVYCIEQADNLGVDIQRVSLPPRAALATDHRPDLLDGVTVVHAEAADAAGKTVQLTAIPYFAWANREPGPMTVWINETAPAAVSSEKKQPAEQEDEDEKRNRTLG